MEVSGHFAIIPEGNLREKGIDVEGKEFGETPDGVDEPQKEVQVK